MNFLNMTINERICYLRKEELTMTLEAFGNTIEMTKGAVSLMEKGKRTVSERTIKIICSDFNVSEEWLRTGEGEIFVKNDNTIISDLAKEYNLEELDKKILEIYLNLPAEQRKTIRVYASSLLDTFVNNKDSGNSKMQYLSNDPNETS